MKIKTKKQLNLPQLIEWAWENEIKNERFIADKQLINIEFDDTGDVLIYGNSSIKTVKFSIEVEEEITENTILEKAIEVYSDEHDCFIVNSYKEKSIKEILGTNIDGYTKTKNIYLFNNDESITLIWTREKGLVE